MKLDKNQLCFTRVTHNSLRLINPWPSNPQSNWNLEMLVFEEGGNPENPEETLGARARTNNKFKPHMTPGPGMEPGTNWREANVPHMQAISR